ncbi:DUF6087 family protein [Streptomyces bacillaris]
MDDEPLAEWAKRRDERIGRLRAVPLVSGDGPKASRLNPDCPRAIQRWNDYTWEPHSTAASLAEPSASSTRATRGRRRHRSPSRCGRAGAATVSRGRVSDPERSRCREAAHIYLIMYICT